MNNFKEEFAGFERTKKKAKGEKPSKREKKDKEIERRNERKRVGRWFSFGVRDFPVSQIFFKKGLVIWKSLRTFAYQFIQTTNNHATTHIETTGKLCLQEQL